MSGFCRWSSLFWGISLAALLVHSSAFAQRYDPSKPCSEGQRRQFDFWLGSWDVTWPASSHGPAGSGRDNVQKILANCVVQENFLPDTSALRATSISTYVPETGQWKQIWADNEGHSRDLTGESKNGEVVLSGQTEVNGKKVLQRSVWKNIKPMELDCNWEQSQDGGQTWQVLWPMHYTRHKQ